MKLRGKKRLTSVIGLSVADGQLTVVHVARAKGGVAPVKAAHAILTVDLLGAEPDLIGHEIKNHLDAAHIHERHCVVALPPSWIMSQHSKLPELSAEDAASLLQLEAEKGFPCDPDELQIARSPHRSENDAYVTQLAVRQDQLARLSAVLRGAGLKPVSLSLGLAALPGAVAEVGDGRITLVIEPKSAALLISAGGGIAALRTLEPTIESEVGEHVVNGKSLARELRITFEQVPADLRRDVRHLALRGDPRMVQQLAGALGDWAGEAGLTLEVTDAPGRRFEEMVVEHLGTRFIANGSSDLEFLPPRPSRWSLMMARYSSRRLATAGFAAAGLALFVALAFGWQEYQRWSLRSEWSGMAAQVTELEAVQGRIREFRPWYDSTFRNLTIMKRVIECFPDTGSVTAKSFEIRGVTTISVSGTARDNGSLLRTLDQLRQLKEVQALKVEQIRGKTPLQFTFTFRWAGATTGI